MKPVVLESRVRADGFRYRRYEADGVRFVTVEAPLALWQALNWQGYAAKALAEHQSELSKKARRLRGLEMLRGGMRPADVARELRVRACTVSGWKTKLETT